MKRQTVRMFGRLMLPTGILIVLACLWMLGQQTPGTPERIVTVVDLVLGLVLITVGLYLSVRERNNKNDS